MSAEAPFRAQRCAPAASRPAPRRAEGVELIGEYEGSGFKEAPFLARRSDGQVIQLTRLLHLVAEAADGERDHAGIATAVSERFGRTVSAGNVQFLIERKLRPLGVLAAADGSSPELPKPDPLLGLRFRTAIVPERVVQGIAAALAPLFWPPVVVLALAGLAVLDVWLFTEHGLGGGLRTALYQPALLLFLLAGVVVATAFHEAGHAAACRYGGARPGALGAGIYLVWPVFYCDVTDAYRLGRAGRLRTDLGGVYFNALVALACFGAYALTRFEPLLLLVVVQHLTILQQLVPLLRLDGYYVVSDLTGVPDILSRLRPILRSLVPGRKPEPSVAALKPWARAAVSVYVVALVPVLLALLVVVVVGAPRLFATAWDSAGLQLDRVERAVADGAVVGSVAGGLQLVLLVLPCAAIVLSFGRLGRRLVAGVAGWASGDALRTAAVGIVAAALVGLAAYTWLPNGDYEPLRPGERVTLQDAGRGLAAVPTGRPSFTEQRAAEFEEVPTVRERERVQRTEEEPAPAREDEERREEPPAREEDEEAAAREEEPTATPSPSPSPSPTPSPTVTPTPTPTPTPNPAAVAPAPEVTPTPAPAETPAPTETPTATP